MEQYFGLAAHKHCDPCAEQCAKLVGLLSCSSEQELRDMAAQIKQAKLASGIKGEVTWSRVGQNKIACYRRIADIFLDSSARLFMVYASAKQLRSQGACFELYHMYNMAAEQCFSENSSLILHVEKDFEKHPCEGRDCANAYVGGSECPAAHGRKPEAGDLHLSTRDLYAVMERELSPFSKLQVKATDEEWQEELLQLLDLLLGATDYSITAKEGSVAKMELSERIAGGLGLFNLKEAEDGSLDCPRISIRRLRNLSIKHSRDVSVGLGEDGLIPEEESLLF